LDTCNSGDNCNTYVQPLICRVGYENDYLGNTGTTNNELYYEFDNQGECIPINSTSS